MNVIAFNQQNLVPLSIPSVRYLVRFMLEKMAIETEEVRLYFIDRTTMTDMHARYLDEKIATDCLSFPLDPPGSSIYPRILGEILVCPEVALQQAQQQGLYRELTLYVIHSLLHLLGFEDQTTTGIEKMRAAEQEWLEIAAQHRLWIQPAKPFKKRPLRGAS